MKIELCWYAAHDNCSTVKNMLQTPAL